MSDDQTRSTPPSSAGPPPDPTRAPAEPDYDRLQRVGTQLLERLLELGEDVELVALIRDNATGAAVPFGNVLDMERATKSYTKFSISGSEPATLRSPRLPRIVTSTTGLIMSTSGLGPPWN